MNQAFIKYFCSIILLLLPGSIKPLSGDVNYQKIFGDDYQFALEYIAQHKKELKAIAENFHVDPAIVASIGFPELMRYSKFRNKLELAALEILYVNYGSSAADFSVGPWQIKPSAVEKLETYYTDSLKTTTQHAFLVRYKSADNSGIRKERLVRLKNERWQMLYLAAFCRIFDNEFQNEKFTNDNEKLILYATAYNHGFGCSIDELKKWQNIAAFPKGMNASTNQYKYSEISLEFLNKYAHAIFK